MVEDGQIRELEVVEHAEEHGTDCQVGDLHTGREADIRKCIEKNY
jgi:hypothetical protein